MSLITSTASIPPSNTIYIQNLSEKIQKQELRRTLYALFSQYGPILDVIALKTSRMRGQAWVAFRDIGSATRAIQMSNNFPLYDRPMRISYSLNKSHSVAKMDGSFGKKDTKTAEKRPEASATAHTEERKEQPAAAPKRTDAAKADDNEPHRILLLINLPEEANDTMLRFLFNQFPGLKEVRQIPTRRDVAFVEFDTVENATTAREGLQGFKIKPDHAGMTIVYAKAG